ncbi:zinc-dependent alcohol dehydrogenase [Nocardioides alcanivorans]|uniref:zinc-dependent alcohol dehydrogenase n=1 Tax=Nocardioides alcanivorans TaxID=2897352 RepID=UPI001F262210|nr:alcohol dehydrogenase catalytic domain-containing protein [Nocardioides alcanivorans]
MRAIRICDGTVSVDDVPEPVAGPRDVIVRVQACGICGSDLSYVKRGGASHHRGAPMALGHEMSGVVVEAGADVRTVAVGDRVVVHPGDDRTGRTGNGAPAGGLAELLPVRDADDGRILHVPADMDLTYAALAEPVAVGINAAERLELPVGAKVAVIGAGPVGLAALAALLDAGITSVVVVEPGATRRAIALELGAEAALDPSDPALWGTLAELHGMHPEARTPLTQGYVEASGQPSMLAEIIGHAAPRARISMASVHLEDVPVSMLLVMMKELEIRGAFEYPERFDAGLDLLARRDLRPMLTDLLSLEEVAAAMADPAGLRTSGKTMAVLDPAG